MRLTIPRRHCSPQDPTALAQTIRQAFNQWEKGGAVWSERKKRCVEKIHNQFSLEKMVNRYESIWR